MLESTLLFHVDAWQAQLWRHSSRSSLRTREEQLIINPRIFVTSYLNGNCFRWHQSHGKFFQHSYVRDGWNILISARERLELSEFPIAPISNRKVFFPSKRKVFSPRLEASEFKSVGDLFDFLRNWKSWQTQTMAVNEEKIRHETRDNVVDSSIIFYPVQ